MTIFPVIVAVDNSSPIRSPARVTAQREASRRALQISAEKVGAPELGWSKDAAGVPLPNEGWHWSVSHKRHYGAAVIADRPIGIDIEEMVPKQRNLSSALAVDEEWQLLGDSDPLSFFRLWTAKEAVLKANGRGISDLLLCRLTEVTDSQHMVLRYCETNWPIEHYIQGAVMAAVTAGIDEIEWCVAEDFFE